MAEPDDGLSQARADEEQLDLIIDQRPDVGPPDAVVPEIDVPAAADIDDDATVSEAPVAQIVDPPAIVDSTVDGPEPAPASTPVAQAHEGEPASPAPTIEQGAAPQALDDDLAPADVALPEPGENADADAEHEDAVVEDADAAASAEAVDQYAYFSRAGAARLELRRAPPFVALEQPDALLSNSDRTDLFRGDRGLRYFASLAAEPRLEPTADVDADLYKAMANWAPTRFGGMGVQNQYPSELLASYFDWAKALQQGGDALTAEEAAETGRAVSDYGSMLVDARQSMRVMLDADYTAHITPAFASALWSSLEARGIHSGNVLLPNSGGGAISRARPLGDSPERYAITQIPNSFIGERLASALSPEDCILLGPLANNVIPSNYYDAAMATLLEDRALPSRRYVSDESVDWEADAPAFTQAGHLMYRMAQAVKPGAPLILACRGAAWGDEFSCRSNLQKLLRSVDLQAPLAASAEWVYGQSPENSAGYWREPALIFVGTKRESLRPIHECAVLAGELLTAISEAQRHGPRLIMENQSVCESVARLLATADIDREDRGEPSVDLRYEQHRILEAATWAATERYQSALNELLPAVNDSRPIAPLLAPAPRLLRSDRAEGVYELDAAGVVSYRLAGALEPVQAPPVDLDRLRSLVALRELTLEALNYQMSSDDDIGLARRQRDLLQAHTGFVQRFGWLSANDNRAAFQDDAFAQNVLRLEVPLDGDAGFERSDFFRRRVVKRFSVTDSAETVDDAIRVCLGRTGRIEPAMMEQLLPNQPWADIRAELGDRIFRDPLVGSYATAEQYLSGPVRAKLASAINAARVDPEAFAINVRALSAAQPVDKGPGDITVDFGASWVPVADKVAFLRELFSLPPAVDGGVDVTYEAPTSTFTVSIDQAMLTAETVGTWVALRPDGDDVPGDDAAEPEPLFTLNKLVGDTLNNRTTKIYRVIPATIDDDGNEVASRKLIDVALTTIASGYQDRLRERWRGWCSSNPMRSARLLNIYNSKINAFKKRESNGDYLRFEGLSPHWVPLSQQRAAIARYVEDGNVLVAHGLGKGKTFSLVGAAIEGAALGVHSKVVMTCPTAVIAGHAASITEAYPSARILVAQGLSKRNQKAINQFISRASMQDWDLILMSYEAVEAIGLGLHAQRDVYQRRLEETKKDSARDPNGTPSRVQAGLIKKIARLSEQISRAEESRTARAGIEAIGADAFFIDEVHNFRNVPLNSKTNVLGINSGGAARSVTMDLIIDHVRSFNGRDRGHASATGTPICNSIAELYTMSRYANPSALRAMGIRHFDAWAALFGKIRGAVEARPAGDGYIFRSRFIQFQNIPELSRAFSMVADVRLDDALTDDRHPRPDVTSQLLIAPATDLERAFMKTLEVRARALDDGSPLWSGEGAITLMGDLKRGMIDLRLMDARIPVPPGGSIDTVVEHLVERHAASTSIRGVQFIFLDEGVNAKAGQFSAYAEIKHALMRRGIPEKEIVVAPEVPNQTAWLKELRRLNRGDARFILGSSTKIGIGINAHQKAIGGVHIDIPQRPDQLLQRIGRYQRPGNSNTTVLSSYLGREGVTNDFERLAAKAAAFISALTDPDTAEATHTDGLDVTLENVQVALTNNHTLRRKVELDAEVRTLSGEREQFMAVTGAISHQLHLKQARLAVLEEKTGAISDVVAAIARESARQDEIRAAKVLAAEAATSELEAAKAVSAEAGASLRALKDEAAAYRLSVVEAADVPADGAAADVALSESTLIDRSASPATGTNEAQLRAARERAAASSSRTSALAAVELPAELRDRLTAAVDAATVAARAVTGLESAARNAVDSSKWYEITLRDGNIADRKAQLTNEIIDAGFYISDYQQQTLTSVTHPLRGAREILLCRMGEDISIHLLKAPNPFRLVDSNASRRRDGMAAVTTDISVAIDLNGPQHDRSYSGLLLAVDIAGERIPFFTSSLESSAAGDVMKMIHQISALSQAALADAGRLRAEIAELSIRAAAPFPQEAELAQKQEDLTSANVELLAQRSSISHAEELRIMEPLRGYTTRSGRPLHPEELQAWRAPLVATDGDETPDLDGVDDDLVGPLAAELPVAVEAPDVGRPAADAAGEPGLDPNDNGVGAVQGRRLNQ